MVKRARVKKREPEKPQEEEAPAEENGEEEESGKRRWLRRKAKSDVEDESEDGRSRLDALKESLEQPLFEKIPLTRKKLLVIIGGMMVLFIIGSIASSVLFGGNDTPSNPTPIENQEPVDEPDPSLNTIQGHSGQAGPDSGRCYHGRRHSERHHQRRELQSNYSGRNEYLPV